jgi:ABC-2 type transport system permease protein
MTALRKLIAVEAKLFFRDPTLWLTSLLLPIGILIILGTVIPQTPDPELGGLRILDVFLSSLVVISLATLAFTTLAIRLATEREKGVLRRLSTTPINPAALITAQLIISVTMAVVALMLLILVSHVAFAVPLPQHALGFITAFLLGMAALFALSLLVAAVAPTARAGTALGGVVFFVVMFVGGVYIPRVFLPEFLQRLGAYVPPGVQMLQDAWLHGIAPQPISLIAMALIAVVAGGAAARLFRWE